MLAISRVSFETILLVKRHYLLREVQLDAEFFSFNKILSAYKLNINVVCIMHVRFEISFVQHVLYTYRMPINTHMPDVFNKHARVQTNALENSIHLSSKRDFFFSKYLKYFLMLS